RVRFTPLAGRALAGAGAAAERGGAPGARHRLGRGGGAVRRGGGGRRGVRRGSPRRARARGPRRRRASARVRGHRGGARRDRRRHAVGAALRPHPADDLGTRPRRRPARRPVARGRHGRPARRRAGPGPGRRHGRRGRGGGRRPAGPRALGLRSPVPLRAPRFPQVARRRTGEVAIPRARHRQVRKPPDGVGGRRCTGAMTLTRDRPGTTRHARSACAPGDALFAERYRAITARDTRFDGQFFTAVSSTGIYCRPSCPARTPRPEHVTFNLTSAAAYAAGFRACKRCLPEAAPATPESDLRGDATGRAMRLISDGVVDREGVDGLAARLGYTPRHVHRLLVTELGAAPLALARARRAQTARALLVGSDLPIADVAFAAGFASLRQFNDTVREVFATTPRDLRARAGAPGPPRAASGGGATAPVRLEVDLPVRLPFDARGVFRFLAARAVTGVEVAE